MSLFCFYATFPARARVKLFNFLMRLSRPQFLYTLSTGRAQGSNRAACLFEKANLCLQAMLVDIALCALSKAAFRIRARGSRLYDRAQFSEVMTS